MAESPLVVVNKDLLADAVTKRTDEAVDEKITSMLSSRLGIQRVGKAVRIVAGFTEEYPNGQFYWGYSADEAEIFAANLIETAREIKPRYRMV